nr:hypothetical protein CFP56_53612 [Quercus suber]
MVQRGADIRKGQVLHFAVERILPGQLAIIDWLVGSGAPVNSRKYEDDPQSWADNEPFGLGTPLHRAADLENVMVVKLLLHHGADPRILDTAGRTAYDLASNKGNEVSERQQWKDLSFHLNGTFSSTDFASCVNTRGMLSPASDCHPLFADSQMHRDAKNSETAANVSVPFGVLTCHHSVFVE